MTVGEIAENFDIAMPSVSKHLAVLREAGLVHEQRRGQFVLYSLAGDNLVNTLYAFMSPFCPSARRIAANRKKGER